MRCRPLLALALASLCLLAATPASAVEPRASLPDIEDEVMCPICGVPLELATEAPQAQQQREFIRELIAEGQSKQQILDALVAEYGPEVLATPDSEGFDLAAWLVPGVAIALAGVAIGVGLRRWRRAGREGPEAAVGPGGLSESEARRLDEDLARYEP